MVELNGSNPCGLLNFVGVGKTLSSQGIATEKAPPPFLQIKPARSFRNKDVMEARMGFEPGACLQTVVAREIIGNNENVTRRVVGLDVGQQSKIVLRVARVSTSGQFLAIAYAQRSIHPGFLRSSAVVQHRLDPVPVWRPARGWWKAAGNDGS